MAYVSVKTFFILNPKVRVNLDRTDEDELARCCVEDVESGGPEETVPSVPAVAGMLDRPQCVDEGFSDEEDGENVTYTVTWDQTVTKQQ